MSVRLEEFVARAIRSGAELTGCIIQCGRRRYKFTGLDEKGRVEILYGENFDKPSRLTDNMTIHSCYLSSLVSDLIYGKPLSGGVINLILECRNPGYR